MSFGWLLPRNLRRGVQAHVSCSVFVTGAPVPVALALGSNLGDRHANLAFAKGELARCVRRLRCSAIYETEPRGVREQPLFLNACCIGWTDLPPRALLDRFKGFEAKAGRPSFGARLGPRVLDIDLLLYGDWTVEIPGLTVPHPRMRSRAFVLVPLAEIAGEWVDPVSGLKIEELVERVSREGVNRWRDGAAALRGPPERIPDS